MGARQAEEGNKESINSYKVSHGDQHIPAVVPEDETSASPTPT